MVEYRTLLLHVEKELDERDETDETREIVAVFGWLEDFPRDTSNGVVTLANVDVRKCNFSLLKSIKMVPSGSRIQLHPSDGFEVEVRFSLMPDEEVIGFRFHEVKNAVTCVSEFYNMHILIRDLEGLRLEPLSGHMFLPDLKYPGEVRWLPATAERVADGSLTSASEIVGIRTMEGKDRSYIIGVMRCWDFNIENLTGQNMMFWIDTLALVLMSYYADIMSDLKQLKLFYQKNLLDYLFFNSVGLFISVAITLQHVFQWHQTASPERDYLAKLVPSECIQMVLLFCAVVSQTHVLLLVLLSIRFRQKHPLLRGAKGAEFAESAISSLVQSNFLVSLVAGIDAISSLELTAPECRSMAISVGISCCCLGLGLAGLDKSDASVMGLPGKVGWGPTMGGLVLVRSLEVASRMAAFNMIHVSLRGTGFLGHLSGPLTALAVLALAKLSFHEAETTDLLVSLFGHPGQVLEPQSLLPLWRSLMIHLMVLLVAGLPQLLLRSDTKYQAWMPNAFDGAKELPTNLLWAWLLTSMGSLLGLTFFGLFGIWLKHPLFDRVRQKDGSITFSSLAVVLNSKGSQVPKAALAAAVNEIIEVDGGHLDKASFQEFIDSMCSLSVSGSTFHHLQSSYTGGLQPEMTMAEAMKLLAQCNLVWLNLDSCWEIRMEEWQQLRGASWQLKKAHFARCFNDRSKGAGGAEILMEVLRTCPLEELNFSNCWMIPTQAWQKLRDGSAWRLQSVNLTVCFDSRSRGASGAEVLMEVLQECPLTELNCYDCYRISPSAWQRLAGATWHLKKANFMECFGNDGHGGGAETLLTILCTCPLEEVVFQGCWKIPDSAWQKLRGASWRLRKANFAFCFDRRTAHVEGAAVLMEVLRACPLEELSLEKCSNIPLAAWQRLQGAEWQLQKGDFRSVFIAGAAKAGEVLMDVLQPCPLIELNFSGCDLGPETWQRVPDGAWLQLRSAPGVPEEEVLRLRQVEAEVIDVEDTTWCPMCAPCGPCGSATEAPHRMLLPKRLTGLSAPRYFSKEFRYQDLLQLLQCPLLELDLSGCSGLGGETWSHMDGSTWRLKRANFGSCFDMQCKTVSHFLLEALRSCPLEELGFANCRQISTEAWQLLGLGCAWQLKKASFSRCFDADSKGVEGAPALLEVLARCPLQELDFSGTGRIRQEWWQKVPDDAWPHLRTAKGVPSSKLPMHCQS